MGTVIAAEEGHRTLVRWSLGMCARCEYPADTRTKIIAVRVQDARQHSQTIRLCPQCFEDTRRAMRDFANQEVASGDE